MSEVITTPRRRRDSGDLLAVGLATTTLMWTVGYLCRIPGTIVPAPFVLVLLLALLAAGGAWAGARTSRGPWGGLGAGLIAGLFNLLILGSLGHDLTTDQRIIDFSIVWVPVSIVLCGALGLLGGLLGSRFNSDRRQSIDGRAALTRTTALATLVLVMAGGMVTGLNAGLSVPDWPDTFQYGMFFFPLSHMTGGVFFEHTHRLLGTLVGLATLVQTIYIWRHEPRRRVKWFAICTLVMVIVQGILGGLRVTGHFTAARTRSAMDPSMRLAIVHGILGQVFFATLVALAAICSPGWRRNTPAQPTAAFFTDRVLAWTLVAALLVQLTLGGILRHVGGILTIHITGAVVVLLLALFCGARAWGTHPDSSILSRLGVWLLIVVTLQVLLGIGAVFAIGGQGPLRHPDFFQAMATTAHQVAGAILLAIAVLLALWTLRLECPPPVGALGEESDGTVGMSSNA